MAAKKEQVGFKTRAADIQESFEGIANLLSTKRTSWSRSRKTYRASCLQAMELGNTIMKSKQPDLEQLSLLAQVVFLHATMSTLAELGEEITEVHQRLTKVEKAMKELKLAMKG